MVTKTDLIFLELVFLAQDYNIPVISLDFSEMGFGESGNDEGGRNGTKAILLSYKNHHMILIDSGLVGEERNLSLAHELGHVKLGHKGEGVGFVSTPSREVEWEADLFGEGLVNAIQNKI